MKKILTIAVLLSIAPAAFATLAEARVAFERVQVEPFARSVLVDYTAAPDASRYDKASGKASFAFAMPYARDMRLKFVTAEFDGGRFVGAKLHVLGFEPKSIDAAVFEKLRDETPMVSVRLGTDDVNPVSVLYPARKIPECVVVTDDLNLGFNAVAYRLGTLGAAISRVGVSTANLAYRVTLTGKDGYAVDLGVSTAKDAILPKTVFANVRAGLEKRDPSRKGTISDRDIVDFRHGGTLSLKAESVGK